MMLAYLTDGKEILKTVDVDAHELAEHNAAANECELFYITPEDKEHADLVAEMQRQKTEGLSAHDLGQLLGWMLPILMAFDEAHPPADSWHEYVPEDF